MVVGKRTLVFIFILLLGLANANFKGATDSIPVEPIRSRGTIIVNASGGGDYTHIQWAIDNASEGDTVYVEVGMYREDIHINQSINIVGAGRNKTTINGSGERDTVQITANWVNISGFNINKKTGYITHERGIFINNSKYCRIQNNSFSSTWTAIGIINCSNNRIERNFFQANFQGVYLYKSDNNNIDNNTGINNIHSAGCVALW